MRRTRSKSPPRHNVVSVRFTDDEYERLTDHANQCGYRNIADFVRASLDSVAGGSIVRNKPRDMWNELETVKMRLKRVEAQLFTDSRVDEER